MKCLHPITIKVVEKVPDDAPFRVRYKSRYRFTQVPCGKCPACLRRRQNSWAFRISKEAEVSRSCWFCTLTIADENLVYGDTENPTLVKSDLSKFMKVLRQNYCRSKGVSDSGIRFYSCGEYGDTFARPHYHCMLFFKDEISKEDIRSLVSKSWPLGHCRVDSFSIGRARYVAKYCNKVKGIDYDEKGVCPPFSLMSRRPGIGESFRTPENSRLYHDSDCHLVIDNKGVKQALPRYYADNFFTAYERQVYGDTLNMLSVQKSVLQSDEDDIYKSYSFNQISRNHYGKQRQESEQKGFVRLIQKACDCGCTE